MTATAVLVATRGVIVSMTCLSVNASPCQRECDARSAGALVTREPTMKRNPPYPRLLRFEPEHPGVGDETTSDRPWRDWKPSMIGRIVSVSALLPSKQPISRGTRAGRRGARRRSGGRRVVPWSSRPCVARPRLGLEVQRGHLVQAQRDVAPAGGDVGEAGRRDLVPVPTGAGPLQRAANGGQRGVLHTEFVQDAQRVDRGRRLNDPRQDQQGERAVADGVEPEPRVGAGQHLPQHRVTLPGDHCVTRGDPSRGQVQLALPRVQSIPRRLQQGQQLGVGVR